MIGQDPPITPGLPPLEPADPAKAIPFLLSTPVIAVVVLWLLWKWAND